jgi:hypothetical protein
MTTTVKRIENTDEGLPQYAVLIDGEQVGVVYRCTFMWSRSAPGRRYTYASGIGITWRHATPSNRHGRRSDTRKQAVANLLNDMNTTNINA